tara:strand:- start:31617 stop:31823 length:207 start_codon:yes stop_codon:yes gene_type:complete
VAGTDTGGQQVQSEMRANFQFILVAGRYYGAAAIDFAEEIGRTGALQLAVGKASATSAEVLCPGILKE